MLNLNLTNNQKGMKRLRTSIKILFFSMLMVSLTSCVVRAHTDTGIRRGWFHRHHVIQPKRTTVIVYDNDNGGRRNEHKDKRRHGHKNH